LAYLDLALRLADRFFRSVQYSWPVEVNAVLRTSGNILLDPDTPLVEDHKRHVSPPSPDANIQLLLVETTPSQLLVDDTVLSIAAKNLFWAFGLGWNNEKVAKWINATVPRSA
jgi:hypothetical protein